MFAKIFAIFALLAVALAAPNPKPQGVFAYSSGLDYAYPGAVPSYVSPLTYSAPVAPLGAYSAYSAYSGLPTDALYYR